MSDEIKWSRFVCCSAAAARHFPVSAHRRSDLGAAQALVPARRPSHCHQWRRLVMGAPRQQALLHEQEEHQCRIGKNCKIVQHRSNMA